MPHELTLPRRRVRHRRKHRHRYGPRDVPYWMGLAPIFVVGLAMFALALESQWITLAILVTCAWIYARIVGHAYAMDMLDATFERVGKAVERRRPERPTVVEVAAAADAPVPVAEPIVVQPHIEPAPPKRAPARSRRVQPVEVSPAKRMLQLEELRETGLVSAAEYQDKRQEILRAI